MNIKSFLVRLLIAVILGPLLLIAVYKGSWYLLALVIIIVMLSLYEFYKLAEKKQVRSQYMIGGAASLAIVLAIYFRQPEIIIASVLLLIILSFFQALYSHTGSPLLNVSITVFGVFYFSFLTGSFLLLRDLSWSLGMDYNYAGGWFLLVFLTTWLGDTAAYVLGSYFGKHKLIKRVSPNKSIEGAVAGFVFSLVAAVICHYWFVHELRLIDSLIVGAIVGSFGQYGDLFESMFKRDVGVKDSSSLIPGHGGVMDRFDSLLVSTPIVYFYLKYIALA